MTDIREDETIEDLQLNGFSLLQKKNGFRFGLDSVLLAHFADIRKSDFVVDFGTGSCVLPLLLIGRNKGSRFTCIEIQEDIAEMAERTVLLNNLEDRIQVICGDAAQADTWVPACSADAIVCNPPYVIPGKGISSPNINRSISRYQRNDTLSAFFRCAYRILRGKGRIFLVFPAPQMLYVMKELQQYHLEPKHFQLVYPYENKPANLVLIEAVKDAKPMLHPMPPMILYQEDQSLTNGLKSVYHITE